MSAEDETSFTGQLLVAMPTMSDPRFEKSVIYMCAHSAEGAMGLVINKALGSLTFAELLAQLGVEAGGEQEEIRVHFGGPVETGRGFVLHSDDYAQDTTTRVDGGVAMTATVDVLKDISDGQGPRRSLLALGYAGWGAGQLDSEIHANGWLIVGADEELIFDTDLDDKWERAIGKLGFDPSSLSGEAGHA
jgi:putative transcriptional regulator